MSHIHVRHPAGALKRVQIGSPADLSSPTLGTIFLYVVHVSFKSLLLVPRTATIRVG